jgi:hypothetical protein
MDVRTLTIREEMLHNREEDIHRLTSNLEHNSLNTAATMDRRWDVMITEVSGDFLLCVSHI